MPLRPGTDWRNDVLDRLSGAPGARATDPRPAKPLHYVVLILCVRASQSSVRPDRQCSHIVQMRCRHEYSCTKQPANPAGPNSSCTSTRSGARAEANHATLTAYGPRRARNAGRWKSRSVGSPLLSTARLQPLPRPSGSHTLMCTVQCNNVVHAPDLFRTG
jgi:hypothetical protein|eukprot:COSAG06_NODE_3075_length_5891_cov_2.111188_7_plen_161_part_00